MGNVFDSVLGRESTNDYAELTDSDLRGSTQSDVSLGFVDVKSQDDIINAKEALHDGKIVILDISYIESNGMSYESICSELQDVIDTVNGDIIRKKRNDIVVVTPRDVSIQRSKI